MTKRKLLLLTALLIAPALRAEGPYGGPKDDGRREQKIEEMHKKLGLSAEQAAQLREHRKAHKEESRALFDQIKTKKHAVKEELGKADFDEAKVRALSGEIKQIQNQLADNKLESILQVRRILTPEQFRQFSDLMRERLDGKDKGKNGRPRRAPGPDKGPKDMDRPGK
jgi:protein CpxP